MSFLRPYEGETSADGRRLRTKIDAGTRSLYTWGGFFILLTIAVAAYLSDPEFENILATLPYLLPGVAVGLFAVYKGTIHPYTWSLTNEAQRQKDEKDRRAVEREDRIYAAIKNTLSLWYVRYPLAVIIALAMYQNLDINTNRQVEYWTFLAAGIAAVLWLAREIAAVAIALAVIVLAWNWLSNLKLSIPGAIVLGAGIIAYAIFATNRKR